MTPEQLTKGMILQKNIEAIQALLDDFEKQGIKNPVNDFNLKGPEKVRPNLKIDMAFYELNKQIKEFAKPKVEQLLAELIEDFKQL